MFDLKTLWEILATVGLSGLVVIILAYAVQIIVRVWANRTNAQTRQLNVSTQQEEIVNTFAVEGNAERRQWEERHHKLQEEHHTLKEEFTVFRIEQAKKEGGLEAFEKMLATEREERAKQDTRYTKLEIRVEELEKNNLTKDERIKELEITNEILNKTNAEKDVIISDLTTKVEQEVAAKNRLSLLVEELNAIDSTPIPPVDSPHPPVQVWNEDSEKTLIVPPKVETTQAIPDIPITPSAATEAAEETKP